MSNGQEFPDITLEEPSPQKPVIPLHVGPLADFLRRVGVPVRESFLVLCGYTFRETIGPKTFEITQTLEIGDEALFEANAIREVRQRLLAGADDFGKYICFGDCSLSIEHGPADVERDGDIVSRIELSDPVAGPRTTFSARYVGKLTFTLRCQGGAAGPGVGGLAGAGTGRADLRKSRGRAKNPRLARHGDRADR
jgi:hypothetical protein